MLDTCSPAILKDFPAEEQTIYGMLGVGNPQLGCGEVAHNPKFDVDESALAPGAFSTMQIALALLNREDSAVQA